MYAAESSAGATWGPGARSTSTPAKDRYANAKPEKGCYTDENTRSCIVSLPEGKVAVINGLKEYIVVDTEDVLLICPRSEEQNIKKFIDEVKYNEGDQTYLRATTFPLRRGIPEPPGFPKR